MHPLVSSRHHRFLRAVVLTTVALFELIHPTSVAQAATGGCAKRLEITGPGEVSPIVSGVPVTLEIGRVGGTVILEGVRAPSLHVTGGGPSTTVLVGGDLEIGGRLTVAIDGRLEIDSALGEESIRVTAHDAVRLAASTLRLADHPGALLELRSGGELEIEAADLLVVDALDHPRTRIASGGDLVLRSAGPVRGDAHWWAGRDLRVESMDGRPGELVSPKDPVVLTTRNVSMGSYTGASLHILAGGSVSAANITITGSDAAANTIGPGNTASFNGSETFADLADVVLSDGTPVAVDGAARATLDIRAGIDWSTFPGGPPVPNDQIVPGGSVSPTFGSPVTTADIALLQVKLNAPGGMVLLSNRYHANPALTGLIVTADLLTSTDVGGSDGGAIFVDTKGDALLGQLVTDASTVIAATSMGSAGPVTVLAETDLTVGFVSARSLAIDGTTGDGGDVTLRALGSVAGTLAIQTTTASGWGAGSGGDVVVDVRGPLVLDNLWTSAVVQSAGDAGDAGDVTVTVRAAGAQDGGEFLFLTDVLADTGSVFNAGISGASGNGGRVELRTEDGAIEVIERIWTSTDAGGGANSSGDGGDVVIGAVNGGISIGALWGALGINTRAFAADGSTGSTGRGGNIDLMADGAVTITPTAGIGGIITSTTSDNGQAGPCGSVSINATGEIDLGVAGIQTDADGRSSVTGPAGPVTLAAGGAIATAFIDTSSIGRSGGSAAAAGAVTIAAGGNVSTGDINAQSVVEDAGGSPGNGGSVGISTSTGAVATGYVATMSVSAAGGGNSGAGGTITIDTPADLVVSPGRSYASGSTAIGSVSGPGGDITVVIGGAVTGLVNLVSSSDGATGSGAGGSVTVDATGPLSLGSVRSGSWVKLSGGAAQGGAVQLTARGPAGGLSVAEVDSDSGCFAYFGALCSAAAGGPVTLSAESGDIAVADKVHAHAIAKGAGSSTGHGGEVVVSALAGQISIGSGGIATRTECIDGGSGNAAAAGNVTLAAAGDIAIAGAGVNASASAVDGTSAGGGNVVISSTTGSVDLAGAAVNTTSESLTGAAGPAGAIEIEAGPGRAVNVGDLFANSLAGNGPSVGPGGAITVTAGDTSALGDLYSFSGASSGVAGDGGAVTVALDGSLATIPKIYSFSRGATATGHGGDVIFDVVGPASFAAIDTSTRLTAAGVALTSGDVSLTARNLGPFDGADDLVIESVSADAGAWTVPSASGIAGDAGTVTLVTGDGDIVVGGSIKTYSGARGTSSSCGDGGDVFVTAAGGGISIGDGGINATTIIDNGSSGSAGRGGMIRLVADSDVVLPSTTSGDGLWSTCTANDGVATGAGEIEVRSLGGAVDLGSKFIAARSVSANGSAGRGGVVLVNASTTVSGGVIDVSSFAITGSAEPAGYVDVRAGGDVSLSRILGTSEGAGGFSDGGLFVVDTGGLLRLTGGSTVDPTVEATGSPGTGWVVLSHGGGAADPFVIGDATTNGSAFAVATTDASLAPSAAFPQSHFEPPSVWILGDEPALLVNELDIDQPGTDDGEFIEVLNPFPDDMPMDLTSFDVVDGSGGYADVIFTPAIRGMSIPANGRLVLCPTGSLLADCDAYDDFSLPNDGPAAVAISLTGIIEDTVSYEGDTPDGYTEGTGVGLEDPGVEDFRSLSRLPDGTDTNHNANDFSLRCVSPGLENLDATFGCTSSGGPELGAVSATPSVIDEGSSVLVAGSFIEPPPAAAHTVGIEWGDGTTTDIPLGAGTTVFEASHLYADDAFGVEAPLDVRVTVTDGVSTDEAWASITVLNVDPIVDAGPDQIVMIGEPVSFSGGFNDPGTLDTHTLLWTFGDGASDDTSLTPTHSFAATGTYTVTLEVGDDDGGIGSDSLFVEVEAAAPRVVHLDTVARAGLGGLTDGEGLRNPLTVVEVGFSHEMLDPAGSTTPVDVTNPDNYRVIAAGGDGVVNTFTCDPPSGDDEIIVLAGVAWDGPTRTAAARIASEASLEQGRYRLILCADGLNSIEGAELDGNGDGVGGDDLVLDFRAKRTDLLGNPNFDLTLGGWTDVSPAGSNFGHVAVDGEGSVWSGSAQASNPAGASARLELNRCIELPPESVDGITLRSLVRMDPAATDDSRAGAELRFFAGPGCTGALLESRPASPVSADTAGSFIPIAAPGRAPAGAVSAEAALLADADSAAPSIFTVAFDRVSVTADGAIFEDGFELGDTAEWDSTTP